MSHCGASKTSLSQHPFLTANVLPIILPSLSSAKAIFLRGRNFWIFLLNLHNRQIDSKALWNLQCTTFSLHSLTKSLQCRRSERIPDFGAPRELLLKSFESKRVMMNLEKMQTFWLRKLWAML